MSAPGPVDDAPAHELADRRLRVLCLRAKDDPARRERALRAIEERARELLHNRNVTLRGI